MEDPIRLVAEGLPDLCPMLNRSPGIHVSHVINDLCVELGHYNPDEWRHEGPDRYTRMGLGSALEHAIIERYHRTYPGRFEVLGELTRDGLTGTPDLIDLSDATIHEMKLTWMSSKHDVKSQKFWKYWRQLQAYCAMLGTTRGVLHVCFVNGNYGSDRNPLYRVWECEWTEEQIESNWRMLVAHAATLGLGEGNW